MHVARVEITLRAGELCGFHICAIGHQILEICTIMMVLTLLRFEDEVESDVTLSEQRMEEIIDHARDFRKIYISSRGRDQFTSDLEIDIEINVRIVIGRYKKFLNVLIDGGDGFVRRLYRPEHKPLYRPVSKDVKLHTYRRYLRRGTHDADAGC